MPSGIAVPTSTGDFTTVNNSAANNVTLAKPINLADGDLLVAYVYFRNGGATITPPTGWTLATNSQQSTNCTFAVYYKAVPTASAETASSYVWNFSPGTARTGGILFRVTGAALSSIIDATGTQAVATGSTSVSMPAVTAVSTGAMLLGFPMAQASTTTHPGISAPTGMTLLTQVAWDNGSSSTDLAVVFEKLTASGSTGAKSAPISPAAGNSGGYMLTVTPLVTNAPPTASFTHSESGLDTLVDGSASSDTDGSVVAYDWDWGDGSAHDTTATATHTYGAAGTYTVTLTVTDDGGATDQATASVTATSGATPALIQVPVAAGDYTSADSGSAASITVNKPANVADGDLLVALVYFRNNSSTITPPSGWTQVSGSLESTNCTMALYTKPIASAAGETPTSYTWSFTGGSARTGGIVFRVTGANLSSVVDASGTQAPATGSSSVAIPPVTSVSASAMLIGALLGQTNTTTHPLFSAPSGASLLTQIAWDNGASSSTLGILFERLGLPGSSGTLVAPISPIANNSNGFAFTVTPLNVNTPPTAAFDHSEIGHTINVDGTTSTDPDGSVVAYDWDWGDGSAHDSGSTASHTYGAAGAYTVTLTVTDDQGATDSQTQTVSVAGAPVRVLVGGSLIPASIRGVIRGATVVAAFVRQSVVSSDPSGIWTADYTDNGDGTWTSSIPTDNGDGTWTA